ARDEAQRIARLNRAGGVFVTLDRNAANHPSGEIVVGRLSNPADQSSAMSLTDYPYNSVRVRARRAAERNGPLDLFFGPVLGVKSLELAAAATATYEDGIAGFEIRPDAPGTTSKLLPFALDVNFWNQVKSGAGPDEWAYDPATGKVTAGADGVKEVRLFPTRGGAPGNFGTIDIGSAGNSTADIKRQILYGPNKSDFDALGRPFRLDPDEPLVVNGDTGISAGFLEQLLSIIGQPRVLPLYEPPVVGNGNNAQYTIVGFAGVIIVDADLTGSLTNKHIKIQPEFVIDETAVRGDAGSSDFVYRPLKLTR
ncbi:MAG TPA: TadG family pilus assembly protein, partial [Gemmataceae bacterium]